MMHKTRILIALAFIVPFVVYAATMAHVWALDTLFAIDSAEMVIAAHTLGIDHPPGHPLYLIFAHLFSRLPFALPDTGVILTSAIFTALACVFLTLALKEATDNWYVAFCTAGTFAFARIFWIHATLAEVYALQLCFLALYVYLCIRLLKNPALQTLYLLSFILGLSTTANILLTVLLMPSALFVILRSGLLFDNDQWQTHTHVKAKLYAFLGMSPLLYIPLRLASESAFISDFVYFNGFPVQSLRWYFWYFSAEEFTGAKLFDLPLSLYPAQIQDYFVVFSSNATLLTLAFALIGLIVCVWQNKKSEPKSQPKRKRQRPPKPPILARLNKTTSNPQRTWNLAVFIAFLTTIIPVLSYRVPDREVFFMPSFFFLIALAGIGLSALINRIPQRFHIGVLIIPIVLLATHYTTITTITDNESRYENRTQRFEQLPPNAIILGPDDGHATRYKYFQIVRNMRPDITIHTMGMLAPRIQSIESTDYSLNFNVSDRLKVIQHLLQTFPDRPLFAILDDRMPPEYDHFRTERSPIDPYLLSITPKPEAEESKSRLPVAVQVEDGYFNTFKFIGFTVTGLDRGQSQTFSSPMRVANRVIHAQIMRSEMFELTYQIQATESLNDKIFAEFVFINDQLQIPSAQGFTAAKNVELISQELSQGTYRQDRFTFKIPGYIQPGFYTLAVRATKASNEIQGEYQGKPIRRLIPITTNRPWQGQTDYRPLGTIQLR